MNGTKKGLQLFMVRYSSLLTICLVVCVTISISHAQESPTVINGPLDVQTGLDSTAALKVNRVGNQISALDIYNGALGYQARFFQYVPSTGNNVLATYLNDAGAYYSLTWMVLSGSNFREPTIDYPMLGIWSDIPGPHPSLVIRPNETSQPNPALGTMDSFGEYRMAVMPDGAIELSGPGTNRNADGMGDSFANTNFDTILHRVGPGQLRTEGSFSANNYVVTLFNDGGNVAGGTVVSVDPMKDMAFVSSQMANDTKVLGVTAQPIAAGVQGPITIKGLATVTVIAPVFRGDLLVSGATVGAAQSAGASSLSAGIVIGKALSATNAPAGTVQQIQAMVGVM